MSVSIDGAGSLIGVDQGLNIVGLTTLTGGIILDDSISHIGDADTKIRFPAADTFTVETAGSERLRITSTGNIIPGTNNSTSIGDGTTNFASIWASTRFRGNDNVKLVLGDSQDLVIRHDGTNNIIGSPVGGDLHIKSGTLDNDNQLIAAFKHSNASVGIGTDNPTSDLHVFKSTSTSSIIDAAAGDALLTLRNAGNTNWSGINFTRERSTGTNVTGGSIWMPSDTANNSATLYIQTQSASANAGESGALTDNNGVRLKLASQPGGSGPNSAFTVEVGSTEKFRILSDGQFETNGVRNIYETFRLRNDTTYNWDYTVPNEGGYGNSFYLVAGYNHYYTAAYGAHRTVWFSSRGTSVNAMGSGIEQSHSQAGSWTFSKPDSTTVRITKTSGTYGGQGYGFFHLMYNHF